MKRLVHKVAFALGFISCLCTCLSAHRADHEFGGGIKFQKAIHLYWENGFTFDYTNNYLWQKRVRIGLSYYTSRLGTAYHSNAIKQDNYLFSVALNFRNSSIIQPIVKLNSGFFYSDMEYEMFKILPHKSPLFSLEGGIAFKLKYPVKLFNSFGYNFITGDGISGPGTLYPFYYQISLLYVVQL